MKMTQADLAEWEKLCIEHQGALSALIKGLGVALKVRGIISDEIMQRWNNTMRRMEDFTKAHPVDDCQ